MPIEMDHPAPWNRERYRFHPWYERPLTERQLQACVVACLSIAAAIVVAGGAAAWLAGWPSRWLVEPIVTLFLVVLVRAAHGVWAKLPAEGGDTTDA